MNQRSRPTLLDYTIIAFNPALIMVMIASLVFFLLECLYRGDFNARLRYIYGLYIFAAVLIARISIEEGRQRGVLFALPLGLAAWFVSSQFIEVRGLAGPLSLLANGLLLALVYWLADRITYDCTLIDESGDSSAQGLLQTLGLEKTAESLGRSITGTNSAATTRTRHNPGVWVIYLAVAALPLFAFGQWLLPAGGARQSALRFLACYLGSALGLLATTSLLSLRRYVRQRSAEVPAEVSLAWLVTSGVGIAALLLAAWLMPLPGRWFGISEPPGWLTSPIKLSASRWGWGNEGVSDGEQSSSAQGESRSDSSSQMEGESERGNQPGGSASQTGSSSRQNAPSSNAGPQGEQGSGQQSGQASSGGSSSSSSSSSSGQPENSNARSPDSQQSTRTDSQQGGEQSPASSSSVEGSSARNSKTDQSNRSASPSAASRDQEREGTPRNPSDRQPDRRGASRAPSDSRPASPTRPSTPPPGIQLPSIASLFKWLIYALLLSIVGYYGIRNWREIQEWWRRLRSSNQVLEQPEHVEQVTAPPPTPPRPFSSFANPFARKAAADECVLQTFHAVEAWAREHDLPRGPDETPAEFAQRLQERFGLQGAGSLADAYGLVVYGRQQPSKDSLRDVAALWPQLMVPSSSGH
jgi:hypothetical protein